MCHYEIIAHNFSLSLWMNGMLTSYNSTVEEYQMWSDYWWWSLNIYFLILDKLSFTHILCCHDQSLLASTGVLMPIPYIDLITVLSTFTLTYLSDSIYWTGKSWMTVCGSKIISSVFFPVKLNSHHSTPAIYLHCWQDSRLLLLSLHHCQYNSQNVITAAHDGAVTSVHNKGIKLLNLCIPAVPFHWRSHRRGCILLSPIHWSLMARKGQSHADAFDPAVNVAQCCWMLRRSAEVRRWWRAMDSPVEQENCLHSDSFWIELSLKYVGLPDFLWNVLTGQMQLSRGLSKLLPLSPKDFVRCRPNVTAWVNRQFLTQANKRNITENCTRRTSRGQQSTLNSFYWIAEQFRILSTVKQCQTTTKRPNKPWFIDMFIPFYSDSCTYDVIQESKNKDVISEVFYFSESRLTLFSLVGPRPRKKLPLLLHTHGQRERVTARARESEWVVISFPRCRSLQLSGQIGGHWQLILGVKSLLSRSVTGQGLAECAQSQP